MTRRGFAASLALAAALAMFAGYDLGAVGRLPAMVGGGLAVLVAVVLSWPRRRDRLALALLAAQPVVAVLRRRADERRGRARHA